MINNIVKFMFRPAFNLSDVFIYIAMVFALPHIGLWALLLAVALSFGSTITEKKVGWEVFNNSDD